MRRAPQETAPLIGLVGFARSGKTEASRFLEDTYGFRIIRPSRVVHAALVNRYGDRQFARPEYRAMSEELRRSHGPGYYLDRAHLGADRALIDGPRHLDTVQHIQQRGGFILGIVARPEVRYARALSAADGKTTPPSLQDFLNEEQPEMNSLGSKGGQILPILWQAESSHIIDTSEMTISEVQSSMAGILAEHGIESAQSRLDRR